MAAGRVSGATTAMQIEDVELPQRDYVHMLKIACKRTFNRAPSIITTRSTKGVASDGSIVFFYTSAVTLPDGTFYSSNWEYPTMHDTTNMLCCDILECDSRLSKEKENMRILRHLDVQAAREHN